MAALQYVRFKSDIISIAHRKKIPVDRLAVRVNYDSFPFQFEIFDANELLDGTKHPPGHVVVAEEFLRISGAIPEFSVIIILRIAGKDIPYIVFPSPEYSCQWAKEVSEAPKDLVDEEVVYITKETEILSCPTFDALKASIHLLRKRAAKGDCMWDPGVISDVVGDVVEILWEYKLSDSNSGNDWSEAEEVEDEEDEEEFARRSALWFS